MQGCGLPPDDSQQSIDYEPGTITVPQGPQHAGSSNDPPPPAVLLPTEDAPLPPPESAPLEHSIPEMINEPPSK